MDEQVDTKVIEVFGSKQAKEHLPYNVPAYTRTITSRAVTFSCEGCGKTVTQQRFPGPVPTYCSPECRMEARRRTIRESVRRHRERKKQEREFMETEP